MTDERLTRFCDNANEAFVYFEVCPCPERFGSLSTVQYQEGLVNFNTVINTLRSLAAQQDQLASAKGTVAANLIEDYGPWQHETWNPGNAQSHVLSSFIGGQSEGVGMSCSGSILHPN